MVWALVRQFQQQKQRIAERAQAIGEIEWTQGNARTREELESLGYLQ